MSFATSLALFFGASLIISTVQAQEFSDYMEGVEYTRISQPLRTVEKAGAIEVREYFWYGCPHCYRLEPLIQNWLSTNPKNVNFQMQPAILGESWAPGAKVFYTAAQLGVLDNIHPALFEGIHVNGNKNLIKNEMAIEQLFEGNGVSVQEFRKAWKSFGVNSKVKQAARMTRRSGIKGVPAIVVNGKYITDAGIAGSYQEMFKVIEYLVAKEMAAF